MSNTNLVVSAVVNAGNEAATVIRRVDLVADDQSQPQSPHRFPGDEKCPVVRADRIWLTNLQPGQMQVLFR